MRARQSRHPFIVFVDQKGRRIEQIDLKEVGEAHSYYEAMVAAADVVQLYTGGKHNMYRVEKITFSPSTGYTFVTVELIPDYRAPNVSDEAQSPLEMEGQMSIDDYDVGGC